MTQPYTLAQMMPTPPPRRRRWPWIAAAVLVLALALTAAAFMFGRDTTQPAAGPAAPTSQAPAAQPAAQPAELRVMTLMTRLGCKSPKVIGTQLYSRETGRCTMSGGDVTIAVFDTATLRDQWVEFGRQYGGSFVVGDGWAAGVASPDAAAVAVKKLGGKRV